MRHHRPSSTVTTSTPDTTGARPANRAERRAAARGRDVAASHTGPAAPRTSGTGVQVRPAHTRVDFAARKSG